MLNNIDLVRPFHLLLGLGCLFSACSNPREASPVGAISGTIFLHRANPQTFTMQTAKKLPVSGLIVKFKPTFRPQSLSTMSINGYSIAQKRLLTGNNTYVYKFKSPLDQQTAEDLAQKLAEDPSIEYAVTDDPIQAMAIPNDPKFNEQLHYQTINLPLAWDKEKGCTNPINVAVIDSGIFQHEDLPRVLPGYDFITDPEVAQDGNGRDSDTTDSVGSSHGLHVAGTIAAGTDNGIGVSGINWCAKILPVRVLGVKDGGSYGTTSDLADAIHWAIGYQVLNAPKNANPAKVINLSLGADDDKACNPFLQEAINDALNANVTIVAAAGNYQKSFESAQPANCLGIIAVGAVNFANQLAFYSNYGSDIILAPGDSILSTVKGGYGTEFGTSMATPHVSGLVSLMLSQDLRLTPAEVKRRLAKTAEPIRNCLPEKCGFGLINAAKALGFDVPLPGTLAKVIVIATQKDSNVRQKAIIEASTETGYRINGLLPGDYLVTACFDSNNNGQCENTEPKNTIDANVNVVINKETKKVDFDINLN